MLLSRDKGVEAEDGEDDEGDIIAPAISVAADALEPYGSRNGGGVGGAAVRPLRGKTVDAMMLLQRPGTRLASPPLCPECCNSANPPIQHLAKGALEEFDCRANHGSQTSQSDKSTGCRRSEVRR